MESEKTYRLVFGYIWWAVVAARVKPQLEDISNGKCLLKCGGRGFCVASHFQQQVGLTESLCSQTATIVMVTDGRVCPSPFSYPFPSKT